MNQKLQQRRERAAIRLKAVLNDPERVHLGPRLKEGSSLARIYDGGAWKSENGKTKAELCLSNLKQKGINV